MHMALLHNFTSTLALVASAMCQDIMQTSACMHEGTEIQQPDKSDNLLPHS